MKIAILGSSGGSAFKAAYSILTQSRAQHQFVVITDRPCGLADFATQAGLPYERIQYDDANSFSELVAEHLHRIGGVERVLLFYTRLVTGELYDYWATYNIHPSLLPSFPGLNVARDVLKANVRISGCTLHKVDATTDCGPIIAQCSAPVPFNCSEKALNKIAYVQKIYLTLLLTELTREHLATLEHPYAQDVPSSLCSTSTCSPALTNRFYLSCLDVIQKQEGLDILG